MSILPDEIWRRILEMGVETTRLSSRDLCCISISCRRLNRLSDDHAIWSTLLALDFPSLSHNTNIASKSLYKTRFERDRSLKLLAHRRAVLNVESQIAICLKNLEDLRLGSLEENEKMKATMAELANLKKARQASVALNVWQPAIVRGRQKQIVEQCAVPVAHRISALEMELKLCQHQIETLNRAYNDQKSKLNAGKERLASLKYHPVREYQSGTGICDRGAKRKKLK